VRLTRGLGTGLALGAGMTRACRGWLLALFALSACGGGVVVETSGAAGGSGGGGAGGGGAGGAGGAPGQSACEQYCEAHAVTCDDEEACLANCLEIASYQGICEPELEAQLLCLKAHPPADPMNCYVSVPECKSELDARLSCVYPAGPCDIGECHIGGKPYIACTITCGGSVYTSDCDSEGPGAEPPIDCDCRIDGELVGTCQAVTFVGTGTLGCCSDYFAHSK